MSTELPEFIAAVCGKHGGDRQRMMDIVREVQSEFGCVSSPAMDLIAEAAGTHRVEVESVVSFYAFLSRQPKGKVVIRLCDDIIDRFAGCEEVTKAFSSELGIGFGETTPDGKITLEHAPCIGMCDQAPAALVNDEVMTSLSTDDARQIVAELKKTPDAAKLTHRYGDGINGTELVHSMVNNNIRKAGEVILAEHQSGTGLKKALGMSPVEVINEIKTSRLRGRGGAGFPTGMKWEFTRKAKGDQRFILCNADEGEPGTFKDRVILTERAELLFEGMCTAGYAVGADTGVLYLRAEYAYLRAHLESILGKMRDAGLLGKDAGGKAGFNFDVRIQMGAGAYICGEESALINSCEGLRGDPRNRPPFPAQEGYRQLPTVVNNVETFCCVPRIIENGAAWFAGIGSDGSPGTKLLSVSGDVKSPGVYEVPFGTKLADFLELCGAEDAAAVQIGGPSGQMVGRDAFDRKIEYDDLATGGAIMVFNSRRDILEIVRYFNAFFCEESCGYCTPCRVGNALLEERLEKIANGRGQTSDLAYLEDLCKTMKTASRCGLGQTAGNPVASALENFRSAFEEKVKEVTDGIQPGFDLDAAVATAAQIAGRPSTHAS
jgi:[NiFe] hydrogenase diaphorase moiety large subunit